MTGEAKRFNKKTIITHNPNNPRESMLLFTVLLGNS